jgi:hypothetical protein
MRAILKKELSQGIDIPKLDDRESFEVHISESLAQ